MKIERSLDLGQKGELLVTPDATSLYEAGAELFVIAATQAMAARGRFTVALSGGSTPKALFALLASDAWRGRVDWSKVQVFWGDERWVPPTDPQSNYHMANEALLSKVDIPKSNIHRVATESGTPEEAAVKYEDELRKVFAGPVKFDWNLLGIETNGHTASLFPHRPTLHVRDRLVISDYIPEVKMNRITFTVPLINDSHAIVFLLGGHEKAAVFKEVVLGPQDPERLPSQLIEPTRGTLTWLADHDAAAEVR